MEDGERIGWKRLPWTETDHCAQPKCEKIAVFEEEIQGWWGRKYCLRHVPIEETIGHAYGPFPLEMAAGCAQCAEYEAVLGVLQSCMVPTYTRGWNTDQVNDRNASDLLWLDERLPWRSEHGPAREKWRGDLEALREAYHKKRSEEARNLCPSEWCTTEHGPHAAHPDTPVPL